MANLKQLKIKRASVDKTRKVTKAMEAVSAVKMRKSQELALNGRAFAVVSLRILNALSKDMESLNHRLVSPKNGGKHGLLLISSDKGLAGSLNSAVLKRVQAFIDKYSTENIVAIAVGRRAYEFLRVRKIKIVHYQENKKDDVSLSDSKEILDKLLDSYLNDVELASWHVAYMNFVSTFEQVAIKRQILPLQESELVNLVEDIAPQKGKYKEESVQDEDLRKKLPYLMESEREELLDDLIPELVNIMIHHSLLESKASEHSARMVAMKSATDKARELSRELMLKFNKARQAAITREVSEITSGVEAMKEE